MRNGLGIVRRPKRRRVWMDVAAAILIVGGLGGFWVFSSSMEARTYNRLTDSDVTTWEAMWSQLRVDCR